MRKLGGDILNADPGRVQDLISLLPAVMKEDQEEIRIRMAFLAQKYANAIKDSQAADYLGHSNLCHVCSTSSNQVRHLRQTNRAETGKGERGGEACA